MGEEKKSYTDKQIEVIVNTNERYRKKIDEIEEKNRNKEKKIDKLKKKLSKKEKKIEQLQRKLSRARDDESPEGSSSSPHSHKGQGKDYLSAKSTSRARGTQRSSKDQLAVKVGRAFVDWCGSAGAAMVDRHIMFADQLTERIPEAEVKRIFREKNAAGVVFTDDAQDAVEYWLVNVKGRDFLLPQPDRSGFREIEKCFEGEGVSPQEVEEVYPAQIQSKDGKRVLTEKGYIS